MKIISTLLSVIAILLCSILFYLFYTHTDQIKKITAKEDKQSVHTFRIAYFDIDSLEAHYNYFKDALDQVKAKENAMNAELSSMEKGYQKKIAEWQQKGNTMTQAESEQASQEYAAMQQNYQTRKQLLQEELFKHNEQVKNDIKKKIEEFLKEYNKQKNYNFIFAYEANTFIYYRDTTFNITKDLIDGLNAGYKK